MSGTLPDMQRHLVNGGSTEELLPNLSDSEVYLDESEKMDFMLLGALRRSRDENTENTYM